VCVVLFAEPWDLLFHRARVGEAGVEGKCAVDLAAHERVVDGATGELVGVILKERKRRLSALELERAAEERRLAISRSGNGDSRGWRWRFPLRLILLGLWCWAGIIQG
jgi:hypothetical protein